MIEKTVNIKFGIFEAIALYKVCQNVGGYPDGVRGIFSSSETAISEYLALFIAEYAKENNISNIFEKIDKHLGHSGNMSFGGDLEKDRVEIFKRILK